MATKPIKAHGSKAIKRTTKLIKASGPKASRLRKSHKKGAHPLKGSGERILLCRKLAYELRMDGHTFAEAGEIIAKRLNLTVVPDASNVHRWMLEATGHIIGEMTALAKEWLPVLIGRQEQMVRRYLPMAMGKLHIARTIMQDGEQIEVIDEQAFTEQLKAADFIRKTIETTAKLLGIGMHKETSDELPGGLRGIQIALIHRYETHIHPDGKALPEGDGPILTMESGDTILDGLDSHQV